MGFRQALRDRFFLLSGWILAGRALIFDLTFWIDGILFPKPAIVTFFARYIAADIIRRTPWFIGTLAELQLVLAIEIFIGCVNLVEPSSAVVIFLCH